MLMNSTDLEENPLRAAITKAYRDDETACVDRLLEQAKLPADALTRVAATARDLVVKVRAKRLGKGGLDAFLYQYDLSNEEGIALMCLAEALLRIPDPKTADKLIKDKLLAADWHSHAGKSDSMFVNATTWGLMLTGKVYDWHALPADGLQNALKKLAASKGETVIRKSALQAMKILGRQFVMGRTIDEAVKRARASEKQGYRYSYDMLGEAARTAADAARYLQSYQTAIDAIGAAAKGAGPIKGPGISIKLSALHPRYEFAKKDRLMAELTPKVLALALQAKKYDLGFTIDAEESRRLDISLDIIEAVFADPQLAGWEGFGLAVQSYQKRAPYVIDWLADLAKRHRRRIMIRLIKGAYWDSEIKDTQERGLSDYPVFTRKASTDVSFIACAKRILQAADAFYPQFATHNAYTVAAVLEMVGPRQEFEFQCLHGMGQTLYDEIVGEGKMNLPCRIYAPVGSHEDLLAYLVRRLLENGANTSFVNRIVDASAPIEEIIEDPVAKVARLKVKPHPAIPAPRQLYGAHRLNSRGHDLTNKAALQQLKANMEATMTDRWQAGPMVGGVMSMDNAVDAFEPNDRRRIVGKVSQATPEMTLEALDRADKIAATWDATPVLLRAACLDRMAELLEQHQPTLMSMAIREAGKTPADAQAEVREAVDFCRYYASIAREQLAEPLMLPGPTGEVNQLSLHARGVIACISPWNFPLAIFIGQITAALVTGNPVIAKPAGQTPLIASYAVKLLHEAGIPVDVIQLLPGSGSVVGAALVNDTRVKGIIFTGSTETARSINQSLANRPGIIVPFIAETGGQNAMIVDSSALPEQVVADVITSAFGSAGQRCSALRVLFLQEEIAPKVIEMLTGAMAELKVGDSSSLATDVGPVIDEAARKGLEKHYQVMKETQTLIYQVPLPDSTAHGTFFAPAAFEIPSIDILEREVFGPILHVIRYNANDIDKVIAAINNTGYGLTFGIHSRIDETVQYLTARLRVGNTYVNRSMIGAVVGVQPFGGEGLSGTGPKAGGPHYLQRLCVERTLTIDTTAAGGNASLMSLQEGK